MNFKLNWNQVEFQSTESELASVAAESNLEKPDDKYELSQLKSA